LGIGFLSRNNRPKTLPKIVEEFMTKEFNLSPIYLKDLRYFENTTFIDDRQLKEMRITSRNLLRQTNLKIKEYVDLDNHPDLVLYDGYIEDGSKIHINDKRVVSYSFNHDKKRV